MYFTLWNLLQNIFKTLHPWSVQSCTCSYCQFKKRMLKKKIWSIFFCSPLLKEGNLQTMLFNLYFDSLFFWTSCLIFHMYMYPPHLSQLHATYTAAHAAGCTVRKKKKLLPICVAFKFKFCEPNWSPIWSIFYLYKASALGYFLCTWHLSQ